MTEPNKFTIQPAGQMHLKRGTDGKIEVSSAQPLGLDLGEIRSVGIHNLVEVAEHLVSGQLGFMTHIVKFHDGGSVEFAFNGKGEVITLRGINVTATIQNGNELLFRMRPPLPAPTEPPQEPAA